MIKENFNKTLKWVLLQMELTEDQALLKHKRTHGKKYKIIKKKIAAQWRNNQVLANLIIEVMKSKRIMALVSVCSTIIINSETSERMKYNQGLFPYIDFLIYIIVNDEVPLNTLK